MLYLFKLKAEKEIKNKIALTLDTYQNENHEAQKNYSQSENII